MYNTEVIAHRGFSKDFPENTLSALKGAIEANSHWVELDCQLTKDSEVVILHDTTIDRVSNGQGSLNHYTLKELQQFDFGSWKDPQFKGEKILTLEQAIDTAKDKTKLLLEIKYENFDLDNSDKFLNLLRDGKKLEVLNEVESYDPIRLLCERILSLIQDNPNIVIQTFSPLINLYLESLNPEIKKHQLIWYLSLWKSKPNNFWDWLNYYTVESVNTNLMGLNEKNLEKLKSLDKKSGVWTVNNKSQMKELIQKGVDYIITDKPNKFWKSMKKINKCTSDS